ncbi:MAG: nuclear transport factor 2 family protein [Prolixibacteraceae bacterium]|nr:nuclear transport factor 2 family protein [Prolixibacteraceae bacterium]
MKKISTFLLITIIGGLFIISCSSKNEIITDPQQGNSLVNELWDNLVASDTAALNLMMADEFQSVHQDGANNKTEELKLISGLSITNYTIDNLISTQDGDVLITTYMVSVEETIEGERLSKKPAARMTVFKNNDGQWQWIAHANLKPLEETKETSADCETAK